MPALRNPKHEVFCQLMFEGAKYGWSQGLIYLKAGFKATGHAAETSASRLMKKDDIRRRLAELGGGGAKKARVTAESLIGKLDIVFTGSVAEKQYSAAGRAVEVQSKLAGVMTDRIEVGGPGEFGGPQTAEEVLELVARELGVETATALAWALDHDGSMPTDEVARVTLKGMTLDEALERNEQLREALLRVASDGAHVVGAVRQKAPPDQVDHQAFAIWKQPKKRKGRR
jgi:hypothetical protein